MPDSTALPGSGLRYRKGWSCRRGNLSERIGNPGETRCQGSPHDTEASQRLACRCIGAHLIGVALMGLTVDNPSRHIWRQHCPHKLRLTMSDVQPHEIRDTGASAAGLAHEPGERRPYSPPEVGVAALHEVVRTDLPVGGSDAYGGTGPTT